MLLHYLTLRRVSSPVKREGKLAKPGLLHNSHWGFICPAEAPEGQACGLVKNRALMAHITVGLDAYKYVYLAELMEHFGIETFEEISPVVIHQAYKVFLLAAGLVLLAINANGLRFVKKGIVGTTYTQEDMPWTVEGITPDVIINPHCIPSRMTIGQLLECIMGKVAAHMGKEGDAIPFTDVTVDNISKVLHLRGCQMHGYETMFNGHTGQMLPTMIFLRPTYFGPVQIVTRQPIEGCSCDGGLQFGEMEQDCLIAHGTTFFVEG